VKTSVVKVGSISALILGCCALSLAGYLFWLISPAAAQEKAPEPSYRVSGMVKDRLELPHPTLALKLGRPNDVPVQLHGYAVHSTDASFTYFDPSGNTQSYGRDTEVTMKYHPDGGAYVEVFPERVGKAELYIGVFFSDGGVQSARVVAEVALPNEKPDKFLVNRGGDDSETTGTVYLDLSAQSNHINLNPKAVYSEEAGPVPIPYENVQFKLISANAADPPIRIDPSTGRIKALHIGHALVQSTFEDFSDLTCVDVMENASYGGDRTNCAELVPPGMDAPLWGDEGKKPPSKIRIVPKP
jgi:hypothetical protein